MIVGLKVIVLSEKSKAEKVKCHRIALISGI
jgi:hypothetical protein